MEPMLTRFVADCALSALLFELSVSPKPGLVDETSTGAHADMDASVMKKSAHVIAPYIGLCAQSGFETRSASCKEAFSRIRPLGLQAEKAMRSATGNVNTHKGAIFSLGLIACAYGRTFESAPDINGICREAARLCAETLEGELSALTLKKPETAGERAYAAGGAGGAREEAMRGYPSVTAIALPAYKRALQYGCSENDAGVYALLHLISSVYDTCLFARGGKDGIAFAQQAARNALCTPNDFMAEAETLNRLFTSRRLSPGGCADLLAAMKFLILITN